MTRHLYKTLAGLALVAALPAQAVTIYVRPIPSSTNATVATALGAATLPGFTSLADFGAQTGTGGLNGVFTGGNNGPGVKSNPNVAGFEKNQNYLEMKNGAFTQNFSGGSVETPGVRVFSFLFSGLDAGVGNNFSSLRINLVNRQGNASVFDVADLQAAFGPGTGRAFVDTQTNQLRITSAVFTATGSRSQYVLDGFASAAPESATWAMLILGFGMAGIGLRRRSKGPAAA